MNKNVQPNLETQEESNQETMEEEPLANTQEDYDEEMPEDTPDDDETVPKQPTLLAQVEADLQNRAAAGPVDEDLRRAQLQMRATEKEKLEEEREQQKAKKAENAPKAKAKGRPRKVEGEPVPKKKRKCKVAQGTAEEDPGEEAEADAEVEPCEEDVKKPKKEKKPKAKAKAKAKADAKRPPRPRKNTQTTPADPEMITDMLALMMKYKDVPYNKDTESNHKVYTKGKSPLWVSIYFGRPAGGVKIQEGEKESQKFYFSYFHSTVAVHIYMCNKMCEKIYDDAAQNVEAWWDKEEAMKLFRTLIVSGGEAQKIFDEKYRKVE